MLYALLIRLSILFRLNLWGRGGSSGGRCACTHHAFTATKFIPKGVQTTEHAAAEVPPDRLVQIIKKLLELDRTGKATFETLAKLTPSEKGKRAATAAGKKEEGGAKEDAEPGNDTPPSTGTEAPAPTPEPQEPGAHGEPDAPTTPEP